MGEDSTRRIWLILKNDFWGKSKRCNYVSVNYIPPKCRGWRPVLIFNRKIEKGNALQVHKGNLSKWMVGGSTEVAEWGRSKLS